MIALRDIWQEDPANPNNKNYLFRGLSCQFDDHRHTAVFMEPGPARTVFLRLLGGSLTPSHGHAWRDCRVSWPIGVPPGFHPHLTGRENLHFIARAFGENISAIVDFIAELLPVEAWLDKPYSTYSYIVRYGLNYAAALAIPFDFYVGADFAPPANPPGVKPKFDALIAARRETSTFIVVSHFPKLLSNYADKVMVMDDGRLWMLDSVADGHKYYQKMLNRKKP